MKKLFEYARKGFSIIIQPDFTTNAILLAVRKDNYVVRKKITKQETEILADNNISFYDEIDKLIAEFEESMQEHDPNSDKERTQRKVDKDKVQQEIDELRKLW